MKGSESDASAKKSPFSLCLFFLIIPHSTLYRYTSADTETELVLSTSERF
jgi:hypothetical protein